MNVNPYLQRPCLEPLSLTIIATCGQNLKKRKISVRLAVCGQAGPEDVETFWNRARALGVERQIVQLPFIPYWRIPEFIRLCRAVCCLEQDFPIKNHSPMIARISRLRGPSNGSAASSKYITLMMRR